MRRAILPALLLLAAAGPPPPPDTRCDAATLVADQDSLGQARVVGMPRAFFLSDDDMAGCPEAGDGCRRGHVSTGDTVLTGRRWDRFTCALLPGGGAAEAGWMEGRDLAPRGAPFSREPAPGSWLGTWRGGGDATLELHAQGERLALRTGTGLDAGGQPRGYRLVAEAGPDCHLRLSLIGDTLVVAADGHCAGPGGPAGVYRRG